MIGRVSATSFAIRTMVYWKINYYFEQTWTYMMLIINLKLFHVQKCDSFHS